MALWTILIGQCPCSGDSRFPWGIWVLVAGGAYAVTWWAESVKKKEGTSRMLNALGKLAIVLALIATVGVVVAMRKGRSPNIPERPVAGASASQANTGPQEIVRPSAALPRLLDLGSTSCIPCKMMAPILEQIKKEQTGKLQVDFIDVWVNKDAGERYGVHLIPCQIFFDGAGKELWRHEGFLGKEEILAKWKELGVELAQTGPSQPSAQTGTR
jgi:thioredoxin 1